MRSSRLGRGRTIALKFSVAAAPHRYSSLRRRSLSCLRPSPTRPIVVWHAVFVAKLISKRVASSRMSQDTQPDVGQQEKLYVVFEGGGAKGIAHVGALAEIHEWEDRANNYSALPDLKIYGYAGTSIGALIACLAAAGWRASELFDPSDPNRNILCDLDLAGPEQLFGRRSGWISGWRLVKIFRALLGWLSLLLYVGWLFTLVLLCFLVDSPLWWVPSAWVMMGAVVIFAGARLALSGLCTTSTIENVINRAIAKKFLETGKCDGTRSASIAASGINFRDFQTLTGVALRVVATDVTKKRLKLFSEVDTPSILISKAVAASMAMPLIFQPVRMRVNDERSDDIGDSLFYDGGLTSNLPCWAFDPERELDPDVLTLIVELKELPRELEGGLLAPFRLGFDTIYTTIFGARELETRQSRRFITVKLETEGHNDGCNIQVLDFDMSFASAQAAFLRAKADTNQQLTLGYRVRRAAYRQACDEIQARFEEMICSAAARKRIDILDVKGEVRVSIAKSAMRLEHKAVKVVHGHNFGRLAGVLHRSGCVDDRLLLPAETHVGRAIVTQKPQLVIGRDKILSPLRPWQYRYQLDAVWDRVEWSFAVPVPPPEGGDAQLIVTIDSSIALHQFNPADVGARLLSGAAAAVTRYAQRIIGAESL